MRQGLEFRGKTGIGCQTCAPALSMMDPFRGVRAEVRHHSEHSSGCVLRTDW